MQAHIQLIQLMVAYTLTGAFIFTVAVTCASLVGWIRFASLSQQRKLFAVIIVEIAITGVGLFTGLLRLDATKVQETLIRDYMEAPGLQARSSDFRDSDFRNSKFSRGLFDKTDFDMSSFRAATFVSVSFSESRFDMSDFKNASFRTTIFTGADFRGADLSKIIIDEKTKLPEFFIGK